MILSLHLQERLRRSPTCKPVKRKGIQRARGGLHVAATVGLLTEVDSLVSENGALGCEGFRSGRSWAPRGAWAELP